MQPEESESELEGLGIQSERSQPYQALRTGGGTKCTIGRREGKGVASKTPPTDTSVLDSMGQLLEHLQLMV